MKAPPNDAIEWCHHYAYDAKWNECDPEELVEELNVESTLDDKATVGKPNHDCPEDEVEKGGIAVEGYKRIVDDYSAFAAELWVNSVSWEKQDRESVYGNQKAWDI